MLSGNMFQLQGLGGIIILALDLWALISIFNSGGTAKRKLLWSLLVIILPIAGFLVWLLCGPRAGSRRV